MKVLPKWGVMTTNAEPENAANLTPDDAFAVLGDETRLGILHTLSSADGPCKFSELYDASVYDDPSNFNYHLKQLEGQFIDKSDDGYALHEAGARVVEAILAGTMTDQPTMERTPVEQACFRCGGQMEISYHEGHVWLHCSRCGDREKKSDSWLGRFHDPDHHIFGNMSLPPAAVQDRTPEELLEAAEVYSVKETHATVRGVCPNCGARVELSVEVCKNHNPETGTCSACGHENNAMLRHNCTNCNMGGTAGFAFYLMRSIDLLRFMAEHGMDPLAPDAFHLTAFEETIVSTDPFKARYTYVTENDSLTLTVDDDLNLHVDSKQ